MIPTRTARVLFRSFSCLVLSLLAASIVFQMTWLSQIAFADSPIVASQGLLTGTKAVGVNGLANDIVVYEGDENLIMHFKPLLDEESGEPTGEVQLAYAYFKESSSASVENPIAFNIPAQITVDEKTWTVAEIGYDSKYAVEGADDSGGGSIDVFGENMRAQDACLKVSSLSIPNTVKTIGSSAFLGLSNLKTVSFNNTTSLTTLKDTAFSNCGFEVFSIPLSVTTLNGSSGGNGGLFSNCRSLKQITIPKSVVNIGAGNSGMFNGCSSLERVVFEPGGKEKTVELNANGMFANCTALTEVDFGGYEITIGPSMFKSCSSLKKVCNFTGQLADNAFSSASGLTTIVLGANTTSLGGASLNAGKQLTQIVFNANEKISFLTYNNNPAGNGPIRSSGGNVRPTLNLVFTGENASLEDSYGRSFGEGLKVFPSKILNVFCVSDDLVSFFETVQNKPPKPTDTEDDVVVNLIKTQSTAAYTSEALSPFVSATKAGDEPVDVTFTAVAKGDESGTAIAASDLKDPGVYLVKVSAVDGVSVDSDDLTFDFTIERSESAQGVYDAIAAVTVPESADDAQAVTDAYNAAQVALEAYENLTDVEKASAGNYVSLLEKIVAIDKLQVELAKAEAATIAGDRDQAKDDLAKAQTELKQAKSDLAKAQEQLAKTSVEKLAKATLTKKTKSAKKGKVTVAWNKVDGATGYEVKVGAKIYTVKKASTLKKTVKAAKGKKVKVQVRAFKKVGDNYQYGPWSKAKKVKVKK